MFLTALATAESFLKFGTFSGVKKPLNKLFTSLLENALLPDIRSLISFSVKFKTRKACISLYASDNIL